MHKKKKKKKKTRQTDRQTLQTKTLREMEIETINVDTRVQEILLAASNHDVPKLRELVLSHENENDDDIGNPVNVRDPETGFTPLHAAIAACEYDTEDEEDRVENEQGSEQQATNSIKVTNGVASHDDNDNEKKKEEERNSILQAGVNTVKFLLQEGAIWNDLDLNDETPGCIARRIGAKELYEMMVDAGVRAELLLNRLEEYEPLEDDDEDEHENENEPQSTETETGTTNTSQQQQQQQQPTSQNDHYLTSHLTFQNDRLLDQDQNGVMMAWERDLMTKSAQKLLSSTTSSTTGPRILNIGHGMGIIDSTFQSSSSSTPPSSHYIVEAHPAVIEQMKQSGWFEKPGVHIIQGRWQDVLPSLCEQGVMFDIIYYDTFAEDYSAFRNFFNEIVIGLLDENGVWSFFNGMGADRQISYDVYQKVVEMDLFEAGFDVEWEDVHVPELEGQWHGVRRPYWAVENYRLPLCKYMD